MDQHFPVLFGRDLHDPEVDRVAFGNAEVIGSGAVGRDDLLDERPDNDALSRDRFKEPGDRAVRAK